MAQEKNFENKLKLMRGEEVPGLSGEQKERLMRKSLYQVTYEARNATYAYILKSTENGTKTCLTDTMCSEDSGNIQVPPKKNFRLIQKVAKKHLHSMQAKNIIGVFMLKVATQNTT